MTLPPADALRQGLQSLLAWMSRGLEATTESDMLASLDERQIWELAEDCGLSPHALLALAKAGPHAADEMPRLMAALNIDASEVEFHMRSQFRAMQANCATCGAKARCRQDLAAGAAPVHFAEYCGNAQALNTLRADPRMLTGG